MSTAPSVPTFDKRTTPARPDIAAEYLRGRIEAARYVAGETLVVRTPASPL
jgi:hypothetical protein